MQDFNGDIIILMSELFKGGIVLLSVACKIRAKLNAEEIIQAGQPSPGITSMVWLCTSVIDESDTTKTATARMAILRIKFLIIFIIRILKINLAK